MAREVQYANHKILVFDSVADICTAAAEFVSNQIINTLRQKNRFYLSLAGGSTPAGLYRYLAENYAIGDYWSQLEIFFGDERYVAHNHQDSNYRMAYESFLGKVSIPQEQVHPIPTDCVEIQQCVEKYSEALAIIDKNQGFPCFDLILLGMGDDGHTASLFPQTDILQEQQASVASVYVEKFKSWRISLTYPVLNMAHQLLVLVTGQAKAMVLADIMLNHSTQYPIANVHNTNGMLWFVDIEAASELNL